MSDDGLARHLRQIAPALLSVVFLEIAVSALFPLVGVQLTMRQTPTALIGAIGSAYFVGFIGGTIFAAGVLDRVGHIRALSVFAIVAMNSALLMALFPEPWLWLPLRAMTGFAMAGIWLTVETWLNHKATRTTRGRLFGAYMVVSGSFSALAPLLLTVVDPAAITLFLVIALCYAAGVVPMALTREANPEIGDRARFGLVRLYAISPLGVIATFGCGLTVTGFTALLPVYTDHIGLGADKLAVLFFAARAGNLMAQYPIGMMSDRIGRRPIILTVIVIGLIGAGLGIAFGDHSFALLVAASILFSSATWPLYALSVGYTNDNCEPREIVAANGGLLMVWAIGGVIGPSAASWTIAWFGHGGLFMYLAAVLAILLGFTAYRITRRPGAPPRAPASAEPKPG
jgi:MFS family permease